MSLDLNNLTITDDHWIAGVERRPLPPRGHMPIRRAVVNHFTGGASLDSSIEALEQRGLSAHLMVDRNGRIVQCVPFDQIAYHAGVSRWRDPNDGNKLYVGCNDFTIGIEIVNAGDDMDGAGAWARHHVPGFATIHAPHQNGAAQGGNEWEIYYPPQIEAVTALNRLLVAHYRLDDVTGHDCIAPERKNDPGPAFQDTMRAIREACGMPGMPAVHWPE